MSQFRARLAFGLPVVAVLAAFASFGPATAVAYPTYAIGRVQPDGKKAAWTSVATYNVPQGTTSLNYSYPCGSGNIAISGGFYGNSVAQNSSYTVGAIGPRIDESSPDYSTWGWHFYWGSGGAPSGTTFNFAVYCQKG
jgi:hypothetical protein